MEVNHGLRLRFKRFVDKEECRIYNVFERNAILREERAMVQREAQERAARLKGEIEYHNYRYYVLDD
ncbi:unnamed protein product, partial [marine sediment metagenome]